MCHFQDILNHKFPLSCSSFFFFFFFFLGGGGGGGGRGWGVSLFIPEYYATYQSQFSSETWMCVIDTNRKQILHLCMPVYV